MKASDKKRLAERFAKDAMRRLLLKDYNNALNDINEAIRLRPANLLYRNIKRDILSQKK